MSGLEIAYASGQLAALSMFKRAALTPTHPAVRGSAVNTGAPAALPPMLKTPPTPSLDPPTLARQFSDVEQNKTRSEPQRKLSADICTSCRKEKHYGPCKRPVPIPLKRADFNMGMTGDDPSSGDKPSTSPHYTTATSQDARPAIEQASTAFRDLLRSRDRMMPDAKVSSLLRVMQGDTTNAWRSFDSVNNDTPTVGGDGSVT